MWIYNLKNELDSQYTISEGIRIVELSATKHQFCAALSNVLKIKYGINKSTPLSKMHKAVSQEALAGYLESSGHWYDPIMTLGDELIGIYHNYITWLSDKLGYDFVFEKNPLVRYHIPGRLDDNYRFESGELFTFHSDTLLGDYFQQINI